MSLTLPYLNLLRPWQKTSVAHLEGCLSRHGAAADMSDGGTGKTYTATALAKLLDRPTVVVCPKPLVPTWHRVGKYLNNESDVINYEMIRGGRTPYGRFRSDGEFEWHRETGLAIFDEAHRCGGRSTLQSKLLVAARRQKIPVLLLSATLADSPLELSAIGFTLGLHDGTRPMDTLANFHQRKISFSQWVRKYGCVVSGGRYEFFGTKEEQTAHMARLHATIIPERGVRVRIADLGDQFPTTQISAELYDIEESGEVDGLYAEMAEALEALAKHAKDDKKMPVVRLLRARQKLELLKVPIFIDLARDAAAQGLRTALFVNFAQSVDEICRRLQTDCRVDGSQTGPKGAEERQRCIDAFQADKAPWIVCNCDAGGVGLSLHGKNRLSLISPGWSAKVFKQVIMRVHRDGGEHSLQRAICLANTVEESVAETLNHKLNRLDALNDADLMPGRRFK